MISQKPYVLLYEGPTDRRFIEAIVEPELEPHWSVEKWKSTIMPRTERNQIVRRAIVRNCPVVVICDVDPCSCYPPKRNHEQKLLQAGSVKCVTVVVREIEGWYLAGMSDDTAAKLGFTLPSDVESITKEDFAIMARKVNYTSIQLMRAILDRFDVTLARGRSASFDHFWRNWIEPFKTLRVNSSPQVKSSG